MFHAARRRPQHGWTLIEGSMVLAVTSLVVGLAAPSFETLRQRHELEALAAQFETDVAYVRSLAVARNETVRLAFAGEACYVAHTGPATECTCNADGSATCQGGGAVLRAAAVKPGTRVALQSNVASMAFDGSRGTVAPTGTLRFSAPDGTSIRAVVNIVGRVRNCSPTLPGYARC